jgi:hypothetical protein
MYANLDHSRTSRFFFFGFFFFTGAWGPRVDGV